MARNSEIIIAKNIKLDNTYKNVLSYNQTQMLNLVNTNKVASANNYSFIRQEQNTVQVGFAYSTICDANYMAFQNKDYNNKWFFAFIRDIQYVSDGCVNIVFDIDVWSTFYSNLTINKCFVEREHVNDDTIGLHTVPEDINAGEMVCEDDDWSLPELQGDYYVVVATDWIPTSAGDTGLPPGSGTQFDGVTVYDNTVSGHKYIAFKLQDHNVQQPTTPDMSFLTSFIKITNIDGHIEDIKDMFIVPEGALNTTSLVSSGRVRRTNLPGTVPTYDETTYFYNITSSYAPQQYPINIDKVKSFEGVTITNNKCYCYPYNYLMVTNNNGNHNIYKYEDFSDEDYATFTIDVALTIGVSGHCVPLDYKGIAENVDESIPVGKYPTCNWTADSFTNWLTQQSINAPTQFAGLTGGILGAVAISNPIGAGLIGVGAVMNAIGNFRAETLKPNIEGGGNTGDILTSNERNGIFFKCMRSKNEYIKIVDDYFTRFGYKINETKTPNLTGRTYWNYIKIGGGDCLATGNIQTKFLEIINKIAQDGVTIWHNHANIGNFSLSNTIVTP